MTTNRNASTAVRKRFIATGKHDNDYNDGCFYMINIRSLINRAFCCIYPVYLFLTLSSPKLNPHIKNVILLASVQK